MDTNKPAFERKDLPKLVKRNLDTVSEYGKARIVAYAADPLSGELMLTIRYQAETELKGKLAERFVAEVERIIVSNPRKDPAKVAPLSKAS